MSLSVRGSDILVVSPGGADRHLFDGHVDARGPLRGIHWDLAKLYGVQTKVLNQAVRRNRGRFPGDFLFQLSDREFESLRSQTVTSKTGRGGRQYRPWAFTEHGTIMAASVLNSHKAIAMSVFVVRAFVRLREIAGTQATLAAKLDLLERRVVDHDGSIQALFQAIRKLLEPPVRSPRRIGFRPDDTGVS